MTDREPQPGDGPDYHADHAAWVERQKHAGKRIGRGCAHLHNGHPYACPRCDWTSSGKRDD